MWGARMLLAGMVGGGVGVGGEPFVEGDGEGEELLFSVEGVDLLDVEGGATEGWVVEALDVVEEVSGEGGVGVDDGPLEAEVIVVLGDFFVDGGALDGEGNERDVNGLGAVEGEEAAVDVVLGGGGDLVAGGGDELEACFVELEGAVSIVGEDDADGEEAVLDVGETEEGAEFGVVAGIGGDGEVLVGVGVVRGVGGGGLCGRGGAVSSGADGGREAEERGGYDGEQRRGGVWIAMRAHAGLIIIIADAAVKLCGCASVGDGEVADDGDGVV